MSQQTLSLKELNKDNFYAICQLSVKDEQLTHVDSNAISIAEASFSEHAWMRGIFLDEEPVGFVMVEVNIETHKFYLWRFMIDQHHQGCRLGRSAIELLLIELKTNFNASSLTTSIVPIETGPQYFYEGLGFKFTGNSIEDREPEMKLDF
jgi:diamine N-acetyltransferase